MENVALDSGDFLVHKFEKLSKLAYKTFAGNQHWIDHAELLEKGLISMDMELCSESDEYDPTQLAAINYIDNNEDRILETILSLLKTQYPIWKQEFGGDPEMDKIWFPTLDSVNDLSKALTITDIRVYCQSKEGISYTNLLFLCPWEEEHGFAVILHTDDVIDHGWLDIELPQSIENN